LAPSLVPGNGSPHAKPTNISVGAARFGRTTIGTNSSENETHFAATTSYIDQNPVKARLVAQASEWPYGSARFAKEDAPLEWRAPSKD
jgi:hypothetical protein